MTCRAHLLGFVLFLHFLKMAAWFGGRFLAFCQNPGGGRLVVSVALFT